MTRKTDKSLNEWQRWVHSYGVINTAKALNVSVAAVYKWLNGECSPTDGNKIKIISLSEHKLHITDFFPASKSA